MDTVNEWRTKWNLSGQYADCTYDDIIKDMADIQPHVRLKAISMIGKAAEFKATYEELGSLSTSYPDSLGKVCIACSFFVFLHFCSAMFRIIIMLEPFHCKMHFSFFLVHYFCEILKGASSLRFLFCVGHLSWCCSVHWVICMINRMIFAECP